MQACKLELPPPNQAHHHPPPPHLVSSIFIDPLSHSLALMLSDSSLLLYPPPTPLSLSLPRPSFPSPTLILPPSSSSCFLRLRHHHHHHHHDDRLLFLSAMPGGVGTGTLLRAWILDDNNQVFTPASLNFKRHAHDHDHGSNKRSGNGAALLDLSHGFSVKLAGGSVNVLALHSLSASKLWVLAGKLAVNVDEDPLVSEQSKRPVIDLLKCSVIDCVLPIFSIRVSLGHLFLGEEKGVRVFPLRPLVKGRIKRRQRKIISDKLSSSVKGIEERSSNSQFQIQGNNSDSSNSKNVDNDPLLCSPRGLKSKSRNGLINGNNDGIYAGTALYSKSVFTWRDDSDIVDLFHSSSSLSVTDPTNKEPKKKSAQSKELQTGDRLSYADYNRKLEADCVSAKVRSVKLRQDSGELGSFFVPFRCQGFGDSICKAPASLSQRAVSIHLLSQEKFLVLDSSGDLHFLSLRNSVGPEVNDSKACSMRLLDCSMKVQMLAVFPGSQTVWISDGSHSVHTILVPNGDIPLNEDKDASREKVLQFSATQAIFTSERIQDIVSFAPNAALILGQGNVFAYSVA